MSDKIRQTLAKNPLPEPLGSIIYLGALILLRAAMQINLFRQGFISVSADEFSRGIRAAMWALEPRLDLFDGAQAAWLPFEKYVNGLFLNIWPDVFFAPRLTVFLGSCLTLVGLYLLVYYLFDSFAVAVLASLFVVFQPWFVWLSGTPMLEMYFLGFYMFGLYFLLIWLKEERRGFWFLAAWAMLIASGFHVQIWILMNLANLLTIGFLFQFARDKQYGRLGRLIAYYFLSNALIIVFGLIEYAETGRIFALFSKHTNYSRWYYDGYNVSVLEKLIYYPRIILEYTSPISWLLLAMGLIYLLTDRNRKWKLFPLALAILNLILSSVLNVLSGPASAAPGRYYLFYMLMLSPYIAYGAIRLLLWGWQRPRPVARYGLVTLAIGLFAYTLIWGGVRIKDYPQGMPADAVEAGQYLGQLLDQIPETEPKAFMVELKYWEFLAVQLTAGHFEDALFDREFIFLDRNTPSIFLEEPGDVYTALSSQNIHYVALRNPDLKDRALATGFLSPQQDIGRWTIYTFNP